MISSKSPLILLPATTVATFSLIIAWLAYRYPNRAIGHDDRPDLPSPPADPILGHLRIVLSNDKRVYHLLWQLQQKYADSLAEKTFTITLPFTPRWIFISGPKNLEHVLKSNS